MGTDRVCVTRLGYRQRVVLDADSRNGPHQCGLASPGEKRSSCSLSSSYFED
jgi:hypothetical protein